MHDQTANQKRYNNNNSKHEKRKKQIIKKIRQNTKKHKITLWMREQDLNLQQRETNPLCYHYTIPQN